MKIPTPKFPKRAHQSFSINNATHLFRKLSYEVHRFTKDNSLIPISGYLALNIAMTAWHMVRAGTIISDSDISGFTAL